MVRLLIVSVLILPGCGVPLPGIVPTDYPEEPTTYSSSSDVIRRPYPGLNVYRGWKEYPIALSLDPALRADQREQIEEALNIWNEAIGETIFVSSSKLPSINVSSFSPEDQSESIRLRALGDQINSIYLVDKWCMTGKHINVLGTTTTLREQEAIDSPLIESDIFLNAEYNDLVDALTEPQNNDKPSVDLISLVLHDLGHSIGLGHVSKDDDYDSVMSPTMETDSDIVNREPSENDILNARIAFNLEHEYPPIDTTQEGSSYKDRGEFFPGHSCKLP